jgi:copper chaperone CopZ
MEPTNAPGGLQIRDIGIAGMSCDNCARAIERALRVHQGVKEVAVDRAAGIARVAFDPTKTDIPQIHEVILRTGYHPITRIPAGQSQ